MPRWRWRCELRRSGQSTQAEPPSEAVARIVSDFGHEAARKLREPDAEPEDQLRGPTERLIARMGKLVGVDVVSFGEVRVPSLSIRPDYAVSVAGARVGYLELKAPGKGVPSDWRPSASRNWKQWQKLALLPNVMYGDGTRWALYRNGELASDIATLVPSVDAGRRLRPADGAFVRLISSFLRWNPEQPRTLSELVIAIGRLCRLLRDEVAENLANARRGTDRGLKFVELRDDWRRLLFPGLKDAAFADAYAQTVTFALLLARVEGIDLDGPPISQVASMLGKKHSVMGKALAVLVEESIETSSVVVDTLLRVIGAVDWARFDEDAFVYLYERFLAAYDPALRRQSGSYYTPRPVVEFMAGFTEHVLRSRLHVRRGFAHESVTVLDPAMGTGSFLAEVMKRAADTVVSEDGEGRRGPALRTMSERLIGFERQAAPYAIAEMRVHQAFTSDYRTDVPVREARFLTDALAQPGVDELDPGLGSIYRVLSDQRHKAERVKRDVPVMVVIANPPYRDKAKGTTPWIESRSEGGPGNVTRERPSLDAFRTPGGGRHEYVLSNLYVYFWRLATWKAFDAHPDQAAGVVTFISPRAFLDGQGFGGMREYLRRTASEAWIIDLSPEEHQPAISTRVFPENQQPLCVAVFVRKNNRGDDPRPAVIHHTSVHGTREEKFIALARIKPDAPDTWSTCPDGWRDPMMPGHSSQWLTYPALGDLMPWHLPGVKPNRTWVYAPEPETLIGRWNWLVGAPDHEKSPLFKESRDAHLDRIVKPLAGFPPRDYSFREESGECPTPRRIAYRSFDRQWVIPDARLHHAPSPELWRVAGPAQVFISEQHTYPITSGPALTFTALIPDMDHYMGHHGGRVLPLYQDACGKSPNFVRDLLGSLSRRLEKTISSEDLLAYIACVTAHSRFSERFAQDLSLGLGVRIPLTADLKIFEETVDIGREVVWLHTFGQRFADARRGRPIDGPRARPYAEMPRNTIAIPDDPNDMPDELLYEYRTRTLHVGAGSFFPVSSATWEYRVNGMPVVRKWFGYRKRNPAGRRSSSRLSELRAKRWTDAMTGELLDLLTILDCCVRLEPLQLDRLERILNHPLIPIAELVNDRVAVGTRIRRVPKPRVSAEQLAIQADW